LIDISEKEDFRMKVIVVGCGRFGIELANRLSQRGHEVCLVDNIPAAFSALPSDFHGRTVEGDALNQDVLRRAGIETADAVAVVTNNDALNMTVGHVARTLYNVPKVAARNYDPHCRTLFEEFGLQVVASSVWGAQRLEELIYHSEIRTIFSAGNGEVEIYEVNITRMCAGQTLSQLFNFPGCTMVAATRAGRAYLPAADFILKENDLVHVSATFEGIEELRHRLCKDEEA
jgi:trk system potassium uptake protein